MVLSLIHILGATSFISLPSMYSSPVLISSRPATVSYTHLDVYKRQPFLQHMGEETGWFTNQDLTTMIAVSESTPGPLGVNMATYVGYETAGVPGALLATLGVITPGIIIILVIASFLSKFRNNRSVEAVFSGLRPASTALIVSAGITVAISVFFVSSDLSPDSFPAVKWPAVALTAAAFVLMQMCIRDR